MTTTANRHGSATVTLPSDTEILITRSFDAPAARVFEAWTTPELVRRWWGFDESVWLECDIDLRVGGRWRYLTREEGGFEVGFHGEYREIDAPHRLVSTEVFEGVPGVVPETGTSDDPLPAVDGVPPLGALNTITLVEADGVTTMTTLVRHAEQAARDMHIESGMEGGMQVSFDRLEDLIGAG